MEVENGGTWMLNIRKVSKRLLIKETNLKTDYVF